MLSNLPFSVIGHLNLKMSKNKLETYYCYFLISHPILDRTRENGYQVGPIMPARIIMANYHAQTLSTL